MFASPSTSRLLLGLLILMVMANEIIAHLGSCEDHSTECGKWESWGFCDTNLKFMELNCPVSCNICLDPECFNRSPFCDSWAYGGACSRSEDVKRLCPHSCDLCRIPDEILPSIIQPDFSCGRPLAPAFERAKRQTNYVADYLLDDVQGRSKRQTGRPPLRISVSDAFCGASVFHERFVITAAHCLSNLEKQPETVRVGELDFSRDSEARSRPVDYRVKRLKVHPQYKNNSLERYNDIALIEIDGRVQFNEFVYPFCLPQVRPVNDATVTGSGFGFVNSTARPNHLQEADLKVVDSNECWKMYEDEGLGHAIRAQYPKRFQGTDILCAAYPGRDPCEGDSGGPLYQDAFGKRFLVGVIGHGISCRGNGFASLPGLYISVADHIDFINSFIYP